MSLSEYAYLHNQDDRYNHENAGGILFFLIFFSFDWKFGWPSFIMASLLYKQISKVDAKILYGDCVHACVCVCSLNFEIDGIVLYEPSINPIKRRKQWCDNTENNIH